MRNLKKFLALVLAMVMAFSLMVSANAAVTKNATDVYPDGENVLDEFVVAVDVLSGMGIFRGDNGNFKPQASIMRSEVAAMMYRLVSGDVEDKQKDLYIPMATHFSDVTENDWYAGYVGFCYDKGLIKGYNGKFNPNGYVTGFETLAMVLRAVGYGQNGEYTGATWQINVATDAQRLGILNEINSTHYANTLAMNSAREVVAQMVWKAARLPQVRYELGMYNPYIGVPITGTTVNPVPNPSLAKQNFGLNETTGIVIGNQDTGEAKTILGYSGVSTEDASGATVAAAPYSAYAWKGTVLETTNNAVVPASANVAYNLVTGIDLLAHEVHLYYCDGTGTALGHFSNKDVYAHYDWATLTKVVELGKDDTLVVNTPNVPTTLGAAAASAGFTVNGDTKAVFNNYFGRSGSSVTAGTYGDGVAVDGTAGDASTNKSPVRLYALISNSDNKALDVVIPLNIETSRVTESNAVRGIPTVAMPVDNGDANNKRTTDASPFVDVRSTGTPKFISTGNVATVGTVSTGILAQAALVHDSTTTLGDYEMGIHINGTTNRATLSTTEVAAINGSADEVSWFLLNKVDNFVTGTVIAYNVDLGTVTLNVNGEIKTLNRSQFYNTVVLTNTPSATVMPEYALPQSVAPTNPVTPDGKYVESYNFASYKFYLDYAGNYLGAERAFPNDFFYGTYLDYEQKTSSSTFKYYLTGVTLDGKMETREVSRYYTWDATQTSRVLTDITGTDELHVPFRDSVISGGKVNGLNQYMGYAGFTYSEGLVDDNLTADVINQKDYANNMARLGVIRAMSEVTGQNRIYVTGATSNGMMRDIYIGWTEMTLGAVQTEETGVDGAAADSNLYLTEDTRIILVSGYGEDSCVPEVYNGISDLVTKNEAKSATIHLNPANTVTDGVTTWYTSYEGTPTSITDGEDIPYAAETYFMKAPDVFNQSGKTAERVSVVILPKAAVTFDKSTSTDYFMGDPHYSLVSSHEGTMIYEYTVYDMQGNGRKVWLTNAPYSAAATATNTVYNDSFLTLGNSIGKASDGKDVYTATFKLTTGTHSNFDATLRSLGSLKIDGVNQALTAPGTANTPTSTVIYRTTTRDALTATFEWCNSGSTVADSEFLKVQGANVTNLNAANSPLIGGTSNGYVWPGITDLATLNAAGSINPVTGTPVRVAAVVAEDGLTVTQIFVCWDQNES
ncbi:MAG: S-layer homology domain-containing protein [Clostridiales bacterium]|nr:S-layer homology domain-containing protein [Clostridiales bacterium]